jgi:histidine ammonia-lyase
MRRPGDPGRTHVANVTCRSKSIGSPVHTGFGAPAPLGVGARPLEIADVVSVALHGRSVALAPVAIARMEQSRRVADALLHSGVEVYGLTTGVGPQKRVVVGPAEQAAFNRLMVLGHAVGYGPFAPRAWVRATMLVRAAGLAQGVAGVRPAVAQALLAALNADAIPSVHLIGSIGQSDLAPLAEIASCLIGAGPEPDLIARAGLAPLALEAREGLALISANAFSVAIGALALGLASSAQRLLDDAAALTFEALRANTSALDPAIATVRPQHGVAATIARIRGQLAGGALLSGARAPRALQDTLCVRVVPQTHGASRQALDHARTVVEIELGSSNDNPIVLGAEDRAFSAGNHDGAPLVIALDYARLGLAQPVTIACERVQRLLNPAFSHLASGLRAGADSPDDGLTMLGHGAAALASEARLLAAPTALEQPTSALAEGIEDRITLAPASARRLEEMSRHAFRIACIELVCAAQALDLDGRVHELGAGTAAIYARVRRTTPFLAAGEPLPRTLDALEQAMLDAETDEPRPQDLAA